MNAKALDAVKPFLDWIPLIVFFYIYKTTDHTGNQHIIAATTGLMITTLIVYGLMFVLQKFSLEKRQWLVVALTVIFGGLTMAFQDDFYIRLKAPIINAVFAFGMAMSPLFLDGKPAIQKMLGQVFEMSDKQWLKLNWIWVAFFCFMAFLQAMFAFVWTKYWAEFTAFGDIIVMVVFMVSQFWILRRYMRQDVK